MTTHTTTMMMSTNPTTLAMAPMIQEEGMRLIRLESVSKISSSDVPSKKAMLEMREAAAMTIEKNTMVNEDLPVIAAKASCLFERPYS